VYTITYEKPIEEDENAVNLKSKDMNKIGEMRNKSVNLIVYEYCTVKYELAARELFFNWISYVFGGEVP
jgi:hypothetical protein